MKVTKLRNIAILTITAALAVHVQAQSFLTNGLIAYYPFNGNANDASGNGNNGVVYGAQPTTDRLGYSNSAYYFNGSNEYISIPPVVALSNAVQATISMWVEDLSPIQTGSFLGDWNETNGGIYLNDYLGVNFGIAILPNGQITTSTSTLVGSWHHVVVVFDGTQSGNATRLTYYQDGISNILTFPYTIPATLGGGASSILIGARQVYGSPGDFFLGLIDDIRIYNRALSDGEVQQLYLIEAPAIVSINKAVYLASPNLKVGTNYQLEVSTDLINWTNSGDVFTATNSTWRSTNYWDVVDWNQLYFRLQMAP